MVVTPTTAEIEAVPPEPWPPVRERVAAVLGWSPTRWRPVHGGYTPAARYVGARGADRCFLKVATNDVTARMLRAEARAYLALSGAFLPAFLGFDDDAAAPLLLIEDLTKAHWPPPWGARQIDQVVEQAHALHAMTARLSSITETMPTLFAGWATVAEAPAPFLSLGVASADWLERALPALIEAAASCPRAAPTVAHFDLRSDNICFTDSGAKFVDWAAACLADPGLDLGGWLPSLELEGGPPPEATLPGRPDVAAAISGYFAARAGLPVIPSAPRVRTIQARQLAHALPWAKRALGLPDLG
ncbi:MAG: phosphotransferase [Caulobacteraceae bacterium]